MILIAILVVLYVGTAAATVSFAGLGDTGTGLNNSAIAENVFAALAHPVMGPAAILLSLAILVSAMASINSTAISPARTLLAMSHYGALPASIKKIHPKYKSPYRALLLSSVVASVFYAVMRFISEDVLWDTITALGMMVFHYGITALASPWYFRKAAVREGTGAIVSKVVLPGIGGVLLLVVFSRRRSTAWIRHSDRAAASAASGSSASSAWSCSASASCSCSCSHGYRASSSAVACSRGPRRHRTPPRSSCSTTDWVPDRSGATRRRTPAVDCAGD
ncbi:hypothetical protein EVAR_72403_1 [Eumeta japonica]|uniref:Amino acid permease/ SLC12A domain-containing protein n=1 Tax=Eumeta variegata TaxID=151549 RepID=A0A4C1SR21_EUMVA|nr:hypothetical protein EVAR_72403_1 [Eumeta japonica]